MATSPYFNHHKSKPEQSLHESLVIETIKLSGVDVYYLPATREEIDLILGESLITSFNQMVAIEVYMTDGGRLGGEGDIMSKFGLSQRDTLDVVMSKRRFVEQAAKIGLVGFSRPREGDLIFVGDIKSPLLSQVNELFEITHVTFEENAWSFGKTFTFKVTMSSYTHGYEKFNTATPLDSIMADNAGTEMAAAINNAVQTTKQTLVRFDKNNPLANT